MTLKPTPVSIIEGGGTNVNHAAVSYNGTLYFINGANLYTGTGDPALSANQALKVSSYLGSSGASKVYSISNVYSTSPPNFWFNTDKGILPSNGATVLGSPAMKDSTGAILSSPPVVWGSGTVQLTGSPGGFLAYYYGPKLNSGLAPSAKVDGDFNNGDPKWTTLSSMLGLSQGSQLQTALNKLDQAVTGVATDAANYAYLASGIGTYRLDSTLLGQTPNDLGNDFTNGNDGAKPTSHSILLQTEDGTLIGPVSTYSDTSSKAFTFAGTTRGLYASSVATATTSATQAGTPTGDGKLPILTETTGLNISTVVTLPHAAISYFQGPNTAYTAAYSATSNEILIYKDLSQAARLPALAGLPSGTLQLSWHVYKDTVSHLLLVVAGTDATVEYPVDTWQ